VTVTARNSGGQTATSYTGTVHFTNTHDAAAVLPADYKFVAGDHGVHTFSVVLKTVAGGTKTVSATAGSITGISGAITVAPGAAAKLSIAGIATSLIPGTPASATVTARDAYNNVATGYVGAIRFTSTDSAATLPGNYTFVGGDAGVHSFASAVIFRTAGTRILTATDTITGSITGSLAGIVIGYPASTFTATSPARVLDTRPTSAPSGLHHMGAIPGALVAGTVYTFYVANVPYVGGGSAVAVPAGAVAVTGNLTVCLTTTGGGVIALGPTMTATGKVTTLSFSKGDVRAHAVTVGLAPGGSLQAVFRSPVAGAQVHLIFDVTGYFMPNLSGAKWHAVTPGRVLDTRPTNAAGGIYHSDPLGSGPFVAHVVRNVKVAGVVGVGWSSALVPMSATAVTGNVTVTLASADGFVAFGPTLSADPPTSTLNTTANMNAANGVTVALSNGNLQAVWVGKAGSSAYVIFDVTGYFTTDGSGQAYHAITPVRIADSTTGKGGTHLFLTDTPQTVTIGGIGEVPSDAVGISGNITVINPSADGYAFIGPVPIGRPPTSTVNTTAHVNMANDFDVKLSSTSNGYVAIVWDGSAGCTANISLDVTGYWK
jgi:hypothetical protein